MEAETQLSVLMGVNHSKPYTTLFLLQSSKSHRSFEKLDPGPHLDRHWQKNSGIRFRQKLMRIHSPGFN